MSIPTEGETLRISPALKSDAGGSPRSSSCVSRDGLAHVIAPTRGPKPRLGQLGWYRGVSAQQQIPSLDGRDFLIG